MQATVKQSVNGVDVAQLFETIDAIKSDPSLASCEFRERNEWIDGAHNRTEVQGFYAAGQEDTSRDQPFVFDADEPPALLGENRGATPVEYLLKALAACLTTSMVYHAAARGMAIEGVRARLEGDLDLRGFLGLNDDVRNGYQQIRVTFEIDGDLSADEKEELCRLAQSRSPVFDIVTNPVAVEVGLATA